jgi:hypothetical protein
MSKDGITPQMIEATERKRTLVPALQALLVDRIVKLKTAPGATPEMIAKAESMADDYVAKAKAQPAMFFRGHSVPSLMRALAGV